MPMYSPTQSTLEVKSEPLTEEQVEAARKNQASSGATKIVYILLAIAIIGLLIMTVVGPHIPAGE